MAASLSAYWVKFFKGAGFPLDVATKHAVVFSNNRIKPDMLPDLDKPSLKEMGITLMGDMIAILRYAKKVVEETTCERFLVDTEDDKPRIAKPLVPQSVAKKIVPKVPSKSRSVVVVTGKGKTIQDASSKPAVKCSPASTVTRATVVKKKTVASPRVVSQVTKEAPKVAPVVAKRKLVREVSDEDSESEDDDDNEEEEEDEEEEEEEVVEWTEVTQKRVKLASEGDKVGYTVIMPKGRTTRSQEILKKITEQKRTVFDRLGDSSVTSTTNLAEASTTFNITGLGNDVLKRNSSVFKRLGDKDAKKMENPQVTQGKNGTSGNANPILGLPTIPQGILKTRPSSIGSTTISLKQASAKLATKSTGTMHADHEKSQKTASSSVRQLVRTTKKIRLNDVPTIAKVTTKVARKIDNPASKLASERVGSVPAKARLGLSGNSTPKQVTFNRVTKVVRIKKPGVFSRLGI